MARRIAVRRLPDHLASRPQPPAPPPTTPGAAAPAAWRQTFTPNAAPAIGRFKDDRAEWKGFVAAMANAANGPSGGGPSRGGGGGGGFGGPVGVNLNLPRMQEPHDIEWAALLFSAVDAATKPFHQAETNLRDAQRQGRNDIAAAERSSRANMNQDISSWRNETQAIDGRIGNVYQETLASLANEFAKMQRSSAARGGRGVEDQDQLLQTLASQGANERAYGLRRLQAGNDQASDSLRAVTEIMQAGRADLDSNFAQMLGGILQQRAAADAAARAEHQQTRFAMRQEIQRINHELAVREAMARAGLG